MAYYIYILRCADGSLYTGSTNQVARRLAVHQGGKGAKYTRSRRPLELVYQEEAADRSAALRREAAIKKLTRLEKLALIEGNGRFEKERILMKNIKMQVAEQIATVTIERPKALNAMNMETLQELRACFGELKERKDIRVVILTGSGSKAFVAGADIAEMAPLTPAEARNLAMLGHETFWKLENLPQVTIAAVNGYALGGGCEMSLCCDIRIAAENAVFGLPECSLGTIPGWGGTQRLARLIGKGRAKEMIFTGGHIDAGEAYHVGLVNRVVSAEALMETCYGMAEKIRGNGSYAVSLAKSAIDASGDVDLYSGLKLEANSFANTFATHDQKEGMEAFLEKRPAHLTDF